MSDTRPLIVPNPPRWRQNPDPASIVIPGLDTSASILDQIEQIDQLITVRLQNIDENFSTINNILANGILPELRRYAVATEPVREAAKFWASFYEHAAQVSIPTYADNSALEESADEDDGKEEGEEEQEQPDVTQRPPNPGDESGVSTSTDTSFQPTQALYSSTPATIRRPGANPPSWASFESPVDRLSREVAELGRDADDLSQILPSALKTVKGKQPLIRNVLRQNLEDASISTIAPSPVPTRKPAGAPKQLNPYLPSDSKAEDWSGIVDLKSTPLSTPNRHRTRASKKPATAAPAPEDEDDDDSFLELPPGMSPPRVMSPALGRPSMFRLGKTPSKEAAARISRDLIQKERGTAKVFTRESYDTTSSTLPTPLSFGHNASKTESDFTPNESVESMMRRARLNLTASVTAPLRIRQNAPTPAEELPSHVRRHLVDDDLAPQGQGNSDSDSEDDGTDFLVARPSVEDSFSSESSTSSASVSMVQEGMAADQPYYQQPVEDYGDDDSFSDDGIVGPSGGDTDTIFGGAAARLQGRGQDPPSHLSLMGNELDTVQFGNRLHVRLNPYASQESPTTFRR